ncbi:MAG TPA: type II secretion system protein [Candidatus Angelobacter sp.]|nr:type II secretion system protein [Candidatus Angelobacter sp.]
MSRRTQTAASSATTSRNRPRGFSLLEMLISVAVLVVLTGAVFEQITLMQRKSLAEETKVDTEQQAREFVDQMVRDLHMAGYPKASMYSTSPDDSSQYVAAGLVSASPTQIILEGDVNSDGFVESVQVGYLDATSGDPNCPCIRRSAIRKQPLDPLSQPVAAGNYTETGHVIPPGTNPGESGSDLFTFYDSSGTPVSTGSGIDINSDPQDLGRIATVKINVSLLTRELGAGPGETARTSLSATARLEP